MTNKKYSLAIKNASEYFFNILYYIMGDKFCDKKMGVLKTFNDLCEVILRPRLMKYNELSDFYFQKWAKTLTGKNGGNNFQNRKKEGV